MSISVVLMALAIVMAYSAVAGVVYQLVRRFSWAHGGNAEATSMFWPAAVVISVGYVLVISVVYVLMAGPGRLGVILTRVGKKEQS